MDLHPGQQHILSFCTGGGGLDLGIRLALRSARVIGYVEIEAYACAVLATRLEAGELDAAPVWTDLRSFDSRQFRGCVDGIVAGYPCQPFSLAGRRQGEADERHLWPVVAEHIDILRPGWCFFENVANHLRLGFADVARDLHRLGYEVAAGLFRASDVGAPHRRERLFIFAATPAVIAVGRAARTLADADRRLDSWRRTSARDTARCGSHLEPAGSGDVLADAGGAGRQGGEHSGVAGAPQRGIDEGAAAAELRRAPVAEPGGAGLEGHGGDVADGNESGRFDAQPRRSAGESGVPMADAAGRFVPQSGPRSEGRAGTRSTSSFPPGPGDVDKWQRVLDVAPWLAPAATESELCRVADGLAHRMDRLRLLGNGVVPEQAAYAFRSLWTDLVGTDGAAPDLSA